MKEELSKKSFQLIDDYINGRQELSLPVYNKLKAQLNLCIQELEDLVWNRTCDPSQYDKLKKRLALYEYMEKEMQKVFKFYKELEQDKNRREFYKVGKDNQEEKIVMKMKLIKKTVQRKSDSQFSHDCEQAMKQFHKSIVSCADLLDIIKNKGVKLEKTEREILVQKLKDEFFELGDLQRTISAVNFLLR